MIMQKTNNIIEFVVWY